MKPGIQSCVCLLAATVQTGFCQGTFYTSRAAFEAALSSSTTITFEELPVTFDDGGLGESSIAASGVTFTSTDAGLFVRDRFSPSLGTGKLMQHFDSFYPVSVSLPSGVTAFGSDFSGGFEYFSGGIWVSPPYNATLTVKLAGGSSYGYNFTGTYNQWTFFGVTFQQPIASLTFSDGAGAPIFLHEEMLDNVTFGTIPEPSSIALLTLGGFLLGWRLIGRAKL